MNVFLSMARVMIAQWENECISLSVLSMARVMIAQWENECISLSVLSMARVMIAQWENECTSQPWRGISRDFSLADHTRHEPEWQKQFNFPSMAPHNLWRKAEVQP